MCSKQILHISLTELMKYPYVFAENGLVAYRNGELAAKQVIFGFKLIYVS